MVHTRTSHHQEVTMPPARRKTAKPKTEVTHPDGEPGRFTAGTGELAEEMQAAVNARGMTLQKLDGDGAPVGEPVPMPDTTVTLGAFTPDDSGIELAFSKAFDAAPDPVSVEFSTDDPDVAALVRDLARVPIPTAVMERWFPAFVRWPGEDQPLALCKVFVTPQGLYVYTRPPGEAEAFTDGAQPQRYAPILFEETGKPPIATVARNAGVRIITPLGPVIVQPTGGCGCGNRLKRWTPNWARNAISWEDGVKLATDATDGR